MGFPSAARACPPGGLVGWLAAAGLVAGLMVWPLALANPVKRTVEWLLGEAAKVAPGELRYDAVEAGWWTPMVIEGLDYRQGDLRVSVAQLTWLWHPSALVGGALVVEDLTLRGVIIHLPEGRADEEAATATPLPDALPAIDLPLAVTLAQLRVEDLTLHGALAEPLIVDEARVQLHSAGDTVILDGLALVTGASRFIAYGRLTPQGDYPLTLEGEWHLAPPLLAQLSQGQLQAVDEPITGQLMATGSLAALETELTVGGPVALQSALELRQPLQNPQWSLDLRGQLADGGVFVADAAGLGGELRVTSRGDLESYRAQVSATAGPLPEVETLSLTLDLRGDRHRVQVDPLRINSGGADLGLELQGSVGFADPQRPQVDLVLLWQNLRWPLASPQIAAPQGELTLTGSPADYRLALNTRLQGETLGALGAALEARGDETQLTLDALTLTEVASEGEALSEGFSLRGQGRVGITPRRGEVSLQWRQVRYPLVGGDPQVRVPRGELTLEGGVDGVQFALESRVQRPGLPPLEVSFQGDATSEALTRGQLVVEALEGQLQGQLAARWQPEVAWQGQFQGRSLDLHALDPHLRSALDFALTTQGSLPGGQPRGEVVITALGGSFNGRPVDGGGRVAVDGSSVAVEGLRLAAGDAQLEAAGTLAPDQSLDFDFALVVPQLQALLAEAVGRVQAQGQMTGTLQTPVVQLEAVARGVAVGEVSLARATATGTVDVTGGQRSNLAVELRDLVAGGETVESLGLTLEGTPAEHRLTTRVASSRGDGTLALGGQWSTGEPWRGRLNTLTLDDTPAGDWRLAQSVPLTAGPTQVVLGDELCLVNAPARVCATARWSAAQGGEGTLTVEDLEPQRFVALPEDVTVNTALAVEMAVQASPDATITADAEITLRPGAVALAMAGEPLQISLEAGGVQGQWRDGIAQGRLQVDLGDLGSVDGRLERLSVPDETVVGELDLALTDLSFLSVVVPQLEEVAGAVRADLAFDGPMTTPVIRGSVAARDLAAALPMANVRLREGQFTISGNGSGVLSLDGGVASNAGQLTWGGQLDPYRRQGDLRIQGQDFQVLDTADLQVQIAPDLTIIGGGDGVRVRGEVVIPKAYLSPPELAPRGVTPSSDVVIVSAPADSPHAVQGGTPGAPFPLDVRVTVTMGDVTVAATGFEAELGGAITVIQTPDLPPRAEGSLAIENGEFEVFNQRLEVQRGRVLFSGQAIANPGLDVRVARIVEEVTAGAQVTGTVQNPRMDLFSEPAMPDSNILSYLVLGRAPDARSSGETSRLLQAAGGLAGAGGSALGSAVAGSLGLDELGVSSGDGQGLEQASVNIGKYLTPELYVGYGVGLFEAVNTFILRYEFTDNFSLRAASSSEATSGEVTFSFER